MESEELIEVGEHARGNAQRRIGLTMAVVAALLAAVTLMGHRLHTEEVVAQTKVTDGWAFFQAKNGRYHMYAADANLAQLIGPQGAALAETWRKKAEQEQREAEEIRRSNEHLEEETHVMARRANYFDAAEICLEMAIVLCSIALLTGTLIFWQASFAGAALGLVISAFGFLRH